MMFPSGFSDNARYMTLRQDGSRIRETLDRLSSELSTGKKADLSSALGNDLTVFSHIRRSLSLNESFLTGLGNAAMMASTRQETLARLSASVEGLGPDILSVVGAGQTDTLQLHLTDASDRFSSAVMALNTEVADQYLFSGDMPDQRALADPDVILAALRTEVTAGTVTSSADAVAVLDAWFETGGGYDTIAALGSASSGGSVYLGEGERIDAGVTVYDEGVRTTLSGLAMAALVAEGTIPPDPNARTEMATAAANRMIQGEKLLVDTRAQLGVAERRIEAARVQAESTRTALELEETRLTKSDPFETAAKIENVSIQLESLFLLTSRLSNLTLSNYLR